MTMATSVVTAGVWAVLGVDILRICEALIFTTAGLSVERDSLITIPFTDGAKIQRHRETCSRRHVEERGGTPMLRVYDFNYRLSCFCKAEYMLYKHSIVLAHWCALWETGEVTWKSVFFRWNRLVGLGPLKKLRRVLCTKPLLKRHPLSLPAYPTYQDGHLRIYRSASGKLF